MSEIIDEGAYLAEKEFLIREGKWEWEEDDDFPEDF